MTVNRQTVPDASPAVVTPSGDLAVRAAAPAGPSQEAADYAAAQAHRVRLLELCDAVVTSSSRLNDPSAARSVTELRQRLAGDGFQVMVVGDFKRGKSTFVNALLGQRILPVKATPTTAVITQVRFSEEAAAFLYRVEGEEPERIDPRDLDRRITIDNSHPDSPNPFVLAEVTWPLELCRHGVVLVDSPGLNEHVTRDKITLDRLGTADAVVFMQHAIAPMSTAEAQFLRTHLASHDPFFVFTYIDAVEPHEREEVTASARRRIVDVRGHDRDTRRMFFVDARAALRAREQHDDLAYRTSGITGLATALEAYLVTERHKVKVLSPARALRDVTRSLKGGVPHLLELLASDSQDLERRWEDAQGPLRALETEADRIGRDLRNQHLALEQRMAVLLSTCLTKVAAEAPSIAMTVAPDTRLTLVPWNVKARAEQAAKEIAVAVGEEIERRITDWTVSTLEPLVATELAQIAVRTDTQLATFETHLSALRISLSGVGEAALVGQGQEEATMTRALAGGMGFLLGGVAGGLVGARLGPKEALRTLLPSILLYLAWLVTPWGLPTLIAGAVIQAVWQGTKGTQRVATRMREAIGREMSTQILQQAPTLAADAARKFAATSTAPIQQAVDGAMRARIAQVSADVDDARRAQEQGEAAITARRADLRATADRLGDLESRIEDLIGDVEIL